MIQQKKRPIQETTKYVKRDIYIYEKRPICMKRDMERDLWYDTMKKETYTRDFYK